VCARRSLAARSVAGFGSFTTRRGDAGERVEALQQVVRLDGCEAIAGGRDLGAVREERVGFVEEQHRAGSHGVVEHAIEVLPGLADVLADDRAEVDAHERPIQLFRNRLRGDRLLVRGRAGDKHQRRCFTRLVFQRAHQPIELAAGVSDLAHATCGFAHGTTRPTRCVRLDSHLCFRYMFAS
jgi:hypothetical protein